MYRYAGRRSLWLHGLPPNFFDNFSLTRVDAQKVQMRSNFCLSKRSKSEFVNQSNQYLCVQKKIKLKDELYSKQRILDGFPLKLHSPVSFYYGLLLTLSRFRISFKEDIGADGIEELIAIQSFSLSVVSLCGRWLCSAIVGSSRHTRGRATNVSLNKNASLP